MINFNIILKIPQDNNENDFIPVSTKDRKKYIKYFYGSIDNVDLEILKNNISNVKDKAILEDLIKEDFETNKLYKRLFSDYQI
jgi:hypothetical protein